MTNFRYIVRVIICGPHRYSPSICSCDPYKAHRRTVYTNYFIIIRSRRLMIAICLKLSEVPLAKYVDDSYVKFWARGQRFILERVAQMKLTSSAYKISQCGARITQWAIKIVKHVNEIIFTKIILNFYLLYEDNIIYLINAINLICCEIYVINIICILSLLLILSWIAVDII